MTDPLVLAITGASGAVYAARLLQVLARTGHDVHLTISAAGRLVLKTELGIDVDLNTFSPEQIQLNSRLCHLFGYEHDTIQVAQPGQDRPDQNSHDSGARDRPKGLGTITYHRHHDFMAPIASGSFLTGGMVICPCSGTTLSAVVTGGGGNLIHRAASVHLKEQRRLILVPRETPLSLVHLDNMRRACELGAVVLPAMPGWYHGVRTLGDVVDFVVARILDQLDIASELTRRWGSGGEVTG